MSNHLLSSHDEPEQEAEIHLNTNNPFELLAIFPSFSSVVLKDGQVCPRVIHPELQLT